VIGIDPIEASFRLRMAILPELLGPSGFEFDFHTRPKKWVDRLKLVASARDYDAVIVQRKLLDPSHARLLRWRSPRVLYDLDDAVMVQRRAIGRWSQFLKQRRFLATARSADHVVAGNEYLAGTFRDLGCAVTILPTVVDPQHYRVKVHAATSTPALVWIGSRSTLPYLKEWMPAIEAAARQSPGLRLITIANDTVQSDVVRVEHVPWSLETEAEALCRGDVGIAPTPVDQWSIGKSGFKIIQYMATGLPTIASPVGANVEIVTEQMGLLPKSMGDWTDAIVQLAGDVELRTKIGAAARVAVERKYSLDRARCVWKELLESRASNG
jgi:glycosyltransferase involved in cell wall biosynthesis